MAKVKKRWVGWQSFQYMNLSPVSFYGRKPTTILDERVRKNLMSMGVFEELPGNQLRYIGRASLENADGTRCVVDADGCLEFDKELLSPKVAASIDSEMESL